MSAPKIRYHFNIRAALILAAIGLTTALGLYVLWGYQEKRILPIGLEQVREFRKAADKPDQADDQDQKSHNNDLALRHLTQYLDARPDDPEGLDIEAKLRLEAKDPLGAASVYEHLIRVEGAREGQADGRAQDRWCEMAQDARRLAEIYIAISDYRRNSLIARLMPEDAAKHYRYHVAELHAKNLLELLDEERLGQAPVEDANAHLLYALALEGQIVPGQTSGDRVAFVAVQREENEQGEKENEGWEVSVEDGAILEYENALELMDKNAPERMDEKARNERMRDDILAAMRLAGLYQKASRKTIDISEQLRKLIAPPKSRPRGQVGTTLTRSRRTRRDRP